MWWLEYKPLALLRMARQKRTVWRGIGGFLRPLNRREGLALGAGIAIAAVSGDEILGRWECHSLEKEKQGNRATDDAGRGLCPPSSVVVVYAHGVAGIVAGSGFA